MDLVTEQQMTESTQELPNWADMAVELDSYLQRLESNLESLQAFKNNISNCGNNVAAQSKVLVKQVDHDYSGLSNKRCLLIFAYFDVPGYQTNGGSPGNVCEASSFHFTTAARQNSTNEAEAPHEFWTLMEIRGSEVVQNTFASAIIVRYEWI